ncbi:unnamed protein product [Darwinula stevensoni]|uniref:ABC-type glutathione-S-conjugate transporter n=1 Tax=Darwinula stevensoni TaxID=69355 RepID=A0A7R8XE24_9CRUS|nr:unnamed protein product [Darwinula stevensoni]CAG0894912.1 unnamed protein product [Darwinula stevensoni]
MQNLSPEGRSSFVSRLWFSWFTGLVLLGWKRPLAFPHLWDLDGEDTSKSAAAAFDRNLRRLNGSTVAQRRDDRSSADDGVNDPGRRISIVSPLWKAYGAPFLFNGFLQLLGDLMGFASPLLLRQLISFVSGDAPLWQGCVYAAGLLLVAVLQAILYGAAFQRSKLIGMRMRAAVISVIYRKSLRLSPAARKERTVGEMVNLMSVDATRFLELSGNLNMVLTSPVQIGLAFYLLWAQIGISLLAGVGVIILVVPINSLIAARFQKLQVQQMEEKDRRVKLMSEVLNGIKVLKLYAWELAFQRRVSSIRDKELRLLREQAFLGAMNSMVWTCTPFLVCLASLAAFVLVDESHVLDASTVFVSLSLFRIMRSPLAYLSYLTTSIIQGDVAYVPQEAWIRNASIKDNVLFGKSWNETFYEEIVAACALEQDLAQLPAGDLTEIGGKGINLSGGQKQRVSLARAVYSDADVFFMDDPLSAVDSNVGKHVFEHVIGPRGMLRNKTRVLVTHGVTHLPQMDLIVMMQGGGIMETGTYQELLERKEAFSHFVLQFLREEKEDDSEEDLEEMKQEVENVMGLKIPCKRMSKQQASSFQSGRVKPVSVSEVLNIGRGRNASQGATEGRLIQDETAEKGRVKWLVYVYLLKSMGLSLASVMILMHGLSEGFLVGSNMWLSRWSNEASSNGTTATSRRNEYLGVYTGLGLLHAGAYATGAWMLWVLICKAGGKLHGNCLRNVLRSSQTFFDTNPVGRILNRFSQDISTVDERISQFLMNLIICGFEVLGTLVIIIYAVPWFLAAVIPIMTAYYFVQNMYVSTARQLKRLESIWRSPIYSHFGDTVNGISSIRAYGREEQFIKESEEGVDNNNKCLCPRFTAASWLRVRLEALGGIIAFIASLLAVLGRSSLSPALAGLCITYAISISKTFNWMARMVSEVETNIVSVERIKEYCETPTEAPWEIPEKEPKEDWPQEGRVSFREYQTRYREGLGLVLKGISVDIRGGEKDPVLFSGNLRMNLDPFEKHTDEEIWIALELSHLKAFVKDLPQGLQHPVAEGGQNLSAGQKQLICLARALLRKTRILVLDEATAAVDLETDELIQNAIRREFKSCTILTIAHRINTIMDYDRVLVLDEGEIKEFDSPMKLLENSKSIFTDLTRNAGLNVRQ